MNLYRHKSGLLLREGSTDHRTLAEIKRAYAWMPVKGKRVLDIGGCFGGYSSHALINGADSVICIEPEIRNYHTCILNLEGFYNVEVIDSACVYDKEGEIPFYLTTSGKSFGNFSTSKYRGREECKVTTVKFKDILSRFQPEVIKMDCEGQEFDLLREPLPDSVKYFTMELHFNSPATVKPSWLDRSPRLIDLFKDWETVKEPKLCGNLWHTIGGWRR